MPFSRPTLIEIINRIESDLLSRVKTGLGILRRSFLKAVSVVFGSAVNLHFGYLDWMFKQLFPKTATGEYLQIHGEPYDINIKQPTVASGGVDFTGTNGTDIPSGTKIQNDEGDEYETTVLDTISGGTANINVQAITTGGKYNRDNLAIMVLVNPIPGIDEQANVDSVGITGGADLEDDDDYRPRVITRIGTPAMGGNDDDYKSWAGETPGLTLTRVWVFREYNGPFTVYVFFVLDNQDPIFPSASEITDVSNQILAVSPNTSRVTVLSPVDRKIGIYLNVVPNTAAVRESVKNNMLNYFNNNNVSETVLKAALDEVISVATGEVSHEIIALTLDSEAIYPVADAHLGNGDLATLEVLSINGIVVYTIY